MQNLISDETLSHGSIYIQTSTAVIYQVRAVSHSDKERGVYRSICKQVTCCYWKRKQRPQINRMCTLLLSDISNRVSVPMNCKHITERISCKKLQYCPQPVTNYVGMLS